MTCGRLAVSSTSSGDTPWRPMWPTLCTSHSKPRRCSNTPQLYTGSVYTRKNVNPPAFYGLRRPFNFSNLAGTSTCGASQGAAPQPRFTTRLRPASRSPGSGTFPAREDFAEPLFHNTWPRFELFGFGAGSARNSGSCCKRIAWDRTSFTRPSPAARLNALRTTASLRNQRSGREKRSLTAGGSASPNASGESTNRLYSGT